MTSDLVILALCRFVLEKLLYSKSNLKSTEHLI